MRALVVEYGVEEVWRVGNEALGYPPNLVRSTEETRKIRATLF